MRRKQNFDRDWMCFVGEVGPIPKTYAKSGVLAGITNVVDGERFEPFAGAGNMLRALRDILPVGEEVKDDIDAGSMLMGKLPETAKSIRNWKSVHLPHDFRVEMQRTGRRDIFRTASRTTARPFGFPEMFWESGSCWNLMV